MEDLLMRLLEEQQETNRLLRQVLAGHAPMSAVAQQTNGKTVAEVIDLYCAEQQGKSAWTEKTVAELLGSFRLLKDLCGDTPLSQMDRAKATEVMGNLTRLPARAATRPQYRDQSTQELLRTVIPAEDRVEARTVNKVMGRLSAVLKWAVRAGYLPSNPAEGLQISLKRRASADRNAYSDRELRTIYAQTLRWKDAEEYQRFWVPFIGMHTGLRLDEICQLHLSDIRQMGDVWVIDVNADGPKKLKTPSSARVVPIHSRLLEEGFLGLLTRSGEDRLFPMLVQRRDGYGADFSRWWGKWARANVTSDPRTVFHSLRHVVADRLKQAGVQESVISEVLGHSQRSLAMGRYGKDYDVPMLAAAIEKLDFLG